MENTLICALCKQHYQEKSYYTKQRDSKRKGKGRSLTFCSNECRNQHYKKQNIDCECCNCFATFKRRNSAKRSTNTFCSQSCAASYNNTHKTKGTRRSKLECFIEEQLKIKYPDLQIDYNQTDAINAELDVFIPPLNLAFELNGIFHYEPIYGQNKLEKMQSNDHRKFQACLEKGIELCIIDTSSQKYFKPATAIKFLTVITGIIDQKQSKW